MLVGSDKDKSIYPKTLFSTFFQQLSIQFFSFFLVFYIQDITIVSSISVHQAMNLKLLTINVLESVRIL